MNYIELLKTKNNLVSWFYSNFRDLCITLNECEHGFDKENPSSNHLEGSVLNHMNLVMVEAEKVWDTLSTPEKLALLLHDIGKPLSAKLDTEKKKKSFIGHNGISAYMALDILDHLHLPNYYVSQIFCLIGLHMLPVTNKMEKNIEERLAYGFRFSSDLAKKLTTIWKIDNLGRIRNNNQDDRFLQIAPYVCTCPSQPCQEERDDKGSLIILIGPSGAGKTTWVKNNFPTARVLSRDAIIDMTGNEHDTYIERWNHVDQKLIDILLQKEIQTIKDEPIIVVDMLNLSPKTRRRVKSWFPHRRVTYVVFLTGFNSLIYRNKNRMGKDLSNVLIEQMRAFTPPLPNEGYTTIFVRSNTEIG